jgi:hypothetical protein
MARTIFKAWGIGLAVSVLGFVLTAIVHTPLALVGMLISIPGMLGMSVVIWIGRWLSVDMSSRGLIAATFISVPVAGSLFYGAIALVALRLRDRRRKKQPVQ